MTSTISHGEIVQIAEVLRDPRLQQRSVRITGKLESYDASNHIALVSFQGAQLTVETRICALEGVELAIGSMYQFIGETYRSHADVRLRARVARNVDNLDIDLFLQALELRRKFLASQ
ncbi:hypothetical protein ATCC90586_004155 [Pythium insidiosum]|nr:hypothetical protein ATCC90586_004155 [Pythium insidiosum]